jgi:hypothetical protein
LVKVLHPKKGDAATMQRARTGNKQSPKRKTIQIEKNESTANSDDFEMGLIEETVEEQKI